MFKNMKIGVRLAIGFCATLALLIIVAGIGMSRINQINGDIRSLVQQDFPKTVVANDVVDAINVNARVLRNLYIFKETETQKELDRLPEQSRIISEGIAKLEQMITTDAGKASLQKVKDARAIYVQDMGKYPAQQPRKLHRCHSGPGRRPNCLDPGTGQGSRRAGW